MVRLGPFLGEDLSRPGVESGDAPVIGADVNRACLHIDGDLEYVQLFEVSQASPDWATLQTAVAARPGSLWILGNEPECPNQGNMTPEDYAERYHTAREAIMGWDATGKAYGV